MMFQQFVAILAGSATVAALAPNHSLNRRTCRISITSLSSSQSELQDGPPSSSTRAARAKAALKSIPSIDKYPLTTKTNKQLIFDETTGRCFETEIEPHSSKIELEEYSISGDIADGYFNVNDDRQDFYFEMDDDVNMNVESNMPPGSLKTTANSPRVVTAAKTVTGTTSMFSSNEMVPTEILFGAQIPTDIPNLPQEDDLEAISSPTAMSKSLSTAAETSPPESINTVSSRDVSIVEECYNAWNGRDIDGLMNCFDDTNLEYQDSQYLGKFTNKQDLRRHFMNQMNLLPANSQLVLDHIAYDANNGNIGTQWHVETSSGEVPFTKGCSFYTTDVATGRITSGFRCSEMIIKPSKQMVNTLLSPLQRLRAASSARQSPSDASTSRTYSSKAATSNGASLIIEQYFNAWNRRDIQSAINCFVDDCTYQTEDPLFVDTFKGKAALRQHLENNVEALPASCQIILDRIAIDTDTGKIGTTWHLEMSTASTGSGGASAGGIAIPNLRGCSMYTIDKASGLLKTGYDVTEAPVKLPKDLLSISELTSIPGRILFGR